MTTPAERITAHLAVWDEVAKREPLIDPEHVSLGPDGEVSLTASDLRAVLADNGRLEQQHLADASRWTQETGEMRDWAREMLDRSEWLEDQVCRETQRLDAENASLRREHEGLLRLIEGTANLAEQAADERDQMRADNERLTAQVAEARASLASQYADYVWAIVDEPNDRWYGNYATRELAQLAAEVDYANERGSGYAPVRFAWAEGDTPNHWGMYVNDLAAERFVRREAIEYRADTDCEPPADPALGAGVGRDGATAGRERASAAPGDSGTSQTVLEGSTGLTEWTDARDGRTYDLTHEWTDRHGLVWHCDGWHQYWTDPEPRPQMTEGVPGGAMALDDVIDNYGPLQSGDGTERTIIR